MWHGHNVVVWAGSNVKHIIFVFTYNKYKMHDAFLIDFHANKQAKRTARMVFRPTPQAATTDYDSDSNWDWDLSEDDDDGLHCFVTPLCGYINFQLKKQTKSHTKRPGSCVLAGPGVSLAVSYNFVSMQMYALAFGFCIGFAPTLGWLWSEMLKNRKSTTIGRPIEPVSWVSFWALEELRWRTNHVDVRQTMPCWHWWKICVSQISKMQSLESRTSLLLIWWIPIWSIPTQTDHSIDAIRSYPPAGRRQAVSRSTSLVIDFLTDMLMPDWMEMHCQVTQKANFVAIG